MAPVNDGRKELAVPGKVVPAGALIALLASAEMLQVIGERGREPG